MRPQISCALFALSCFAQPLAAEPLQPIPTARQVLGFDIGERPASYDEAMTYLTALQSASARVKSSSYGVTAGGRKLLLLTISSPANLARLEEVQRKLEQLGNAPDERTAVRLIEKLPAVAWMGYGIHGNEISAADAALEVAYRLVSATDSATLALLDNLVIYLDPMFNPDGRQRDLAHLDTFSRRVSNGDAQDLLHQAFWPAGRGNHYFFDLNRDALYVVQSEARARVAAITHAHPQFLADAHEMESEQTHLFAVPAEPFNPHLPAEVHATWRDFSVTHAEAFDREGISYYTRAWNEDFYPGYFDILLAYHGGTPMIYEQGTNAGTWLRMPNGRERSYAQTVSNHVRSSWASLTSASSMRAELLRRWWSARTTARSGQRAKTWLLPPTDSYKQARLCEILRTHGIEFERLQSALPARELNSIWGKTTRSLPAGTLRVRQSQPLGALVHNLFDFHVPMQEDFLERERRGLDLRQDTLLYDATAWSAPHAFAADVAWTSGSIDGNWVTATVDGEATASPTIPSARYGYLYRDPSLAVTARLLQRGLQIRVAGRDFTHAGVQYAPGDLLIRNEDQAQNIIDVLSAEQASSRTQFVAVDSARIQVGPDLGGPDFHLLEQPRIAIAMGAGVAETSAGALWHLFDREIGIPVTLLNLAQFSGVELSRYDTIIFSDGDADEMRAQLTVGGLEALQTWVKAGGTLIAMRESAAAFSAAWELATKLRQRVIADYPPLMLGRSARQVVEQDFIRSPGGDSAESDAKAHPIEWTYPVVGEAARAFMGERARMFAFPSKLPTLAQWLEGAPGVKGLESSAGELLRRYLPKGAYMRVDLKPGHWLNYGVANKVPALFRESDALIADGSAEAVGRYGAARELALSGLIWPEAVGYVSGTAYLVKERLGAGQVILFANDPVFRGHSLGTQRLLMNAAIFGSALR
jgi:hypothetical protein